MAPTVENHKVHHQDRSKQRHRLEQVKIQTHILAHDPADHHDQRRDVQSDLDRGAYGHTYRKVHVVLGCDSHGGDMLRGVSGDGNDDEADECFAQRPVFGHIVDSRDKELCVDGYQACRDNE